MDSEIINPFISATRHVLSAIAETRAKTESPYLKKDTLAKGDVSGVVALNGDLKGTFSISFSKGSILRIVSKMFGEEMTEVNKDIEDAVGEIANMIAGQATQKYGEKGKDQKAKVLTVILGPGHEIRHAIDFPVIAIPFKTNMGNITIEVCLEKWAP